jgi:hypothetical protein
MIKIKTENLDSILVKNYLKVGFSIGEQLSFLKDYVNADTEEERQSIYDNSEIHGNTKKSLLGNILLSKSVTVADHHITNFKDEIQFNKADFSELCQSLLDCLAWILIGPPDILEELDAYFKKQYSWAFKEKTINGKTTFDFILSPIFKYSKLTEKDGFNGWNNSELCSELGAKTCYYCNRQSVVAVKRGKQKIATPQLDHFLDKSSHPLLALSFFNLIPCCSNCNLKKSNADYSVKNNIHPYLEGFDKAGKFSYHPKSLDALWGISDELNIYIKHQKEEEKGKRIHKNLTNLELEAIYSKAHKDDVQELIKKKHISNNSYLQQLINTYSAANLSLEEAYRLAFGNYMEKEKDDQRPLSKLTKDLAEELGLL